MSAHGWSITYPQMMGFGARALSVPGRGNVLCASAFVPFRLDDGDLVRPADWYEAVRAHGGDDAVPDAVAPLPRAELLVLGGVDPVAGEERECTIRCGGVEVDLLLRADPDEDGPLVLGPDAALWHERDNPEGRGGPEDRRRPLIVDRERPGQPVWLGPTSYLHPARQRRLGEPGEDASGGWPGDARAAALHDAHESFWVDGLFPRDPLRLDGVVERPIDVDLPPYRVEMTISRVTESEPLSEWFPLPARVHCVTVIPQAGLAAVFWRGTVELGEDILGENVVGLAAALEEAGAPERDHTELADIAAERWLRPELALDDRPLLPESLHDRVERPFDVPEGETIAARLGAAQEWAQGEMGLDHNPFAGQGGEHEELIAMAQAAVPAQGEMDPEKMREVADAVTARTKRLHEAAGFDDDMRPEARPVVERGAQLEEEVARRLSAPYQAPQEVTIAENLERHPTGVDAAEVLGRMAGARAQSPEAPLFWPPLSLAEAATFGEAVLGRLREGDLARHIDVSGAQVGDLPDMDPRLRPEPDEDAMYEWNGEPPPPAPTPGLAGTLERAHAVRDRRFDGLLAEETGWRGIVFERCVFEDVSFAQGEIENCEFVECTFARVNVAGVVFTDCRFESCVLGELAASETALGGLHVRGLHARGDDGQRVGPACGVLRGRALEPSEVAGRARDGRAVRWRRDRGRDADDDALGLRAVRGRDDAPGGGARARLHVRHVPQHRDAHLRLHGVPVRPLGVGERAGPTRWA